METDETDETTFFNTEPIWEAAIASKLAYAFENAQFAACPVPPETDA